MFSETIVPFYIPLQRWVPPLPCLHLNLAPQPLSVCPFSEHVCATAPSHGLDMHFPNGSWHWASVNQWPSGCLLYLFRSSPLPPSKQTCVASQWQHGALTQFWTWPGLVEPPYSAWALSSQLLVSKWTSLEMEPTREPCVSHKEPLPWATALALALPFPSGRYPHRSPGREDIWPHSFLRDKITMSVRRNQLFFFSLKFYYGLEKFCENFI